MFSLLSFGLFCLCYIHCVLVSFFLTHHWEPSYAIVKIIFGTLTANGTQPTPAHLWGKIYPLFRFVVYDYGSIGSNVVPFYFGFEICRKYVVRGRDAGAESFV